MDLSLMIEAQDGLNWPRWKRLVAAAEDLGFAGLFRSDHFTNGQGPDKDSLELIISLTYLAGATRRIHFGPLVAPISFRHPTLLARQAAGLDDLSGGRLILGLGAGWQEREHRAFGHPLGDVPTRMARFTEGLEVVTQLLRSETPSTFSGQHFSLDGALLLPRPTQPGGPRIMIGGNGQRRTLALTARYADVWNGIALPPDDYRARCAELDRLLAENSRQPSAVKRTMMTRLVYAPTPEALRTRLAPQATSADEDLDNLVGRLHRDRRWLVGPAATVREQIRAFAAAGAQELMLQWFDQDDTESLAAFAREVIAAR